MLQRHHRLLVDAQGQPREVKPEQAYEDGWQSGFNRRKDDPPPWPPEVSEAWAEGYYEGWLAIACW